METLKYFIPINTASLPHYFGKAIILPAQYYQNKPLDLQDQYKGYILLSDRKWMAQNDCTIEVIMAPEEMPYIHNFNDGSPFYFYNGALPISRIVAVHFKDRKQSEITQWNINSATAFLPDYLIKIDHESSYPETRVVLNPKNKLAESQKDLSEKAKRFDILLGGVSFLKAATKKPANFPKDYFAVLSHFNSKIKSELLQVVSAQKIRFNEQLIQIFTNKKSTWSDIQPLFFDEVTISKFENFARNEKVVVEKKFGLIELDQLKNSPNLYILGLLATYGNNKQKSLQDLISKILSRDTISEEQAEEIALIFGLNVRYSGLRNAYNGKALPVKFSMQSQLDYYTIESIFQYTFNGQKESSSFEYLDLLTQRLPDQTAFQGVPSFWILDTAVLTNEKKNFEHDWLTAVRSMYPVFHEQLEQQVEKAIQPILAELATKEKQIISLKNELLANNQKRELSVPKRAELDAVKPVQSPSDQLEQMDFKALKAVAKSVKITAKVYNSLKPTFEGYSKLIDLIRSQKTLL